MFASFWNLVSRRSWHLASNWHLMTKGKILVSLFLPSQIHWRTVEQIIINGSSVSFGKSENSRRSIASGVISVTKLLAICSNNCPMPLLKLHSMNECTRESSVWSVQRVQFVSNDGLSRTRPFLVINKPCSNLKLKDANSLSSPFRRHNLQILSQSEK